jgi:hypothetical protein
MKKAILTILAGTALAVGSTNAAIVFGNLGANGSGAITNAGGTTLSTTQWRAVGFTANGPDLVLDTATLALSVNNNGPATIGLDLYTSVGAGANAAPGTSIFGTTQVIAANSFDKVTFNLNETLNDGASYWLVAKLITGPGTLAWRSPATPAAPTGLNGSGWSNLGGRTSTDTGASWGATGNASGSAISLSASPIPEPGTWAAMAIFAGGAAYVGWRRRQQQLA